MLHRRSTATLVAVLLPLAAALTSCGFDYPTDRVNTIAAGTNNREASVDVLGARVVAYAQGEGRLIGTLVYNDNDAEEPATLDDVSGDGVTVNLPKVEVEPNGHVNLASADGPSVAVEGEFTAGDVLELTYSFSTNESVTLEVPVVKACGQYSDILAPGADAGSAAEEAGEEGEEGVATDEETVDEESDATFVCDHPTESAEH